MSVYLVHCPSLGLCKVGYAVSVARRLLVIKTFVPAPVILIAERAGCRGVEAAIHRELRTDRVHGEWFRMTERTLPVFETARIAQIERSTIQLSSSIQAFLSVVDAYRAARSVSDARMSTLIFNDGSKIKMLRSGGDIWVLTLLRAFQWLSDNWPENAVWPHSVARPPCSQAPLSPSPAFAGSEVTADTRDAPSTGVSSLDCPAPASAVSGALSEGSA